MNKKVVVVGLDGATWNLLKPWVENGELPAMRILIDGGIHGDLESPMPVTVPSWACYSTGKNPGKFGVFGWTKLDMRNKTVSTVNYKDIRSREIWDYLNDYGIRTGIMNIPHTFPPKPVHGFMISGMLASEKANYTYPKNLKKELIKIGYRIHPRYLVHENKVTFLKEFKNIIKSRFRVAREKLDDVDFLHLTIFYIDHLQHFLWGDAELLEVWKIIDKELDKLLKKLQSYDMGYDLILMSDHGFARSKSNLSFYLSNFLAEAHVFSIKRGIFDYVAKLGITLDRLAKLAKKLGIYVWRGFLPKKLLRTIPDSQGTVGFEGLDSRIHWRKSRVFCTAGFVGLVYTKEKGEAAHLMMKKKLMNVRDPNTGEKIIREIKHKKEIFSGQFLDEAPELVLLPKEGYTIRGGITKGSIFLREQWKATHTPEGIFILYGKHIKKLNKSKEIKISIYDLAPTILALYEVPIPTDMDGRVLLELVSVQPPDKHERS